jgi:opacity protein-like surface antigen
MKQICALLSFILAITLSLSGQAPGSGPASEENRQAATETGGSSMPAGFFNTTIGILFGSYKSPDSRFGEVYGDKTSLQFGLNLSRILLDMKGFQLDLSLEARLLRRTGKATLSGEATKITMIPLTLAGRLQYRMKYVVPFIGAGMDWYNYKEESALADTSGWARGYDLQAGVLIIVPGADSLRIKLYFKHTDVTATENEIDVKLGGPEFGVGLSYGFNFLNKAAFIIR